jgi:hypothetical protein
LRLPATFGKSLGKVAEQDGEPQEDRDRADEIAGSAP